MPLSLTKRPVPISALFSIATSFAEITPFMFKLFLKYKPLFLDKNSSPTIFMSSSFCLSTSIPYFKSNFSVEYISPFNVIALENLEPASISASLRNSGRASTFILTSPFATIFKLICPTCAPSFITIETLPFLSAPKLTRLSVFPLPALTSILNKASAFALAISLFAALAMPS